LFFPIFIPLTVFPVCLHVSISFLLPGWGQPPFPPQLASILCPPKLQPFLPLPLVHSGPCLVKPAPISAPTFLCVAYSSAWRWRQ
jgi:hypothetical protein